MIKAIGFRAIIRPKKIEEKTDSGIVLAVDMKMEERAQVIGTLVDFGEDFADAYRPKLKNWGLQIGDEVYYAKYAGKWVVDPETKEELLIVNDEDIVALYKRGDTPNEAGNVDSAKA